MRIIIISNLYPPVVRGGYEMECASVVERLRERHDVLVLTSDLGREPLDADSCVRRELPHLHDDWRGALRAPLAATEAARLAREGLAWRPDLVYAWNLSGVPQTPLRLLADAGVPVAFRACAHLLRGLFVEDQFMRELLPGRRSPLRTVWHLGCEAFNVLAPLRLRPTGPMSIAISWSSEALKRVVPPPSFLDVVLERVEHPVPRHGDLYASVVRRPAETPEVLFLGRVTPFKGISVAIDALALLRSRHGISARLVVMGPEENGHVPELMAQARRLGVQDAVAWRGQGSAEQVASALARASALIVPSLWEEPFGLVTIEGAFARVPIVASDVGGIGEGVHDEEHALLFPRGDGEAAAAALARVFNEPEQTALRVQRARARAEDFRLAAYLDRQERFIEDALVALQGRRRPAGR